MLHQKDGPNPSVGHTVVSIDKRTHRVGASDMPSFRVVHLLFAEVIASS